MSAFWFNKSSVGRAHAFRARQLMHGNAKYCGEYKVWLSFNDGTEGEIDLASELYGQVFEPLKDKEFSSLLN